MTVEDGEDRVGYGRPPGHTRFVRGRSGNPRGRPPRLAQLLAAALDEKAPFAAGARRRVTKREAIVAQLVDKSAGADLRAIKLLIDMWREIEARTSPPPRETWRPTAADEEVVANLVARIRRAEIAARGAGEGPGSDERSDGRPDGRDAA